MSARAIRVLVADDSPLCAEALRTVIDADPRMRVVGIAHDGLRAIELAAALRPTVITMDVHMPRLDGLAAIARIRAVQSARILVVTGDDARGLAFEAMRRGAADVVRRPHPRQGWSAGEHDDLRRRIVALAQVPMTTSPSAPPPRVRPAPTSASGRVEIVGIAASTGGPIAIATVLASLPRTFAAPIVIVQHLAAGFAEGLARWLDGACELRVRLAREGEVLRAGDVRVAPDDVHVAIERGARVRFDRDAAIEGHRPSATRLFSSLAPLGARAAGVVLSGMGRDGASGLAALRRAGGVAIAQDEATSIVFGMPRAARDAGAEVLPLDRIAARLESLVAAREVAS
ncbi:chemotaxis protein CheB [Sandaracinus amylolyticus]|uniref:chemotaxis protein CheB n=1 Tax=Sandaracinus amylolyticus TaxID=927083 RepID=UPI001EFFE721|nr:chemotaxis protein CheB [Sandaracinus amylolyticus]UJR80104.1 Chemotaxis response regulator protein-glutamate methylesterase CheB [Sandaracinus amylolyticus]